MTTLTTATATTSQMSHGHTVISSRMTSPADANTTSDGRHHRAPRQSPQVEHLCGLWEAATDDEHAAIGQEHRGMVAAGLVQ